MAMVTFAADFGDLQTKPNNAYLPLHDIPFWKRQTKDIAMVTSAADLGDCQSKPNKIKHIYPNMIYLFENTRPRTLQWWPLQLILVTTKPNQIMHIYPYMICLAWFGGNIISCKGQNCNGHRCIVLFVGFSKGMSCRGEYALFGLVWFGAPTKKLQRSPSQCPWSGVFK